MCLCLFYISLLLLNWKYDSFIGLGISHYYCRWVHFFYLNTTPFMFLRVKVLVLIDSFLDLNLRFHLLIYTSSFSLSVVFFYAFLVLDVRALALSFSTYFSSLFPVSSCTNFELFLYPYTDLTEQVCYFCIMVWVYQD